MLTLVFLLSKIIIIDKIHNYLFLLPIEEEEYICLFLIKKRTFWKDVN